MAFSGSSYFAGMGTVVAAIAFGVACGSMVTTSVVQPPNRLERVNGDTTTGQAKRDSTPPSTAASSAEQPSTAKPKPADAPPAPVVAAAPSVSAADPQPAPPPQPAAPAAIKADAAASTHDQSAAAPAAKSPAPATVARSDDAAPAPNEHASGRSVDPNRETSHKKAATRKSSDDRKYAERRRRHDQDERQLDEATNVVRQMPRERAVGDMVGQDDGPRVRIRPRHFELLDDDGPPRRAEGPPPGFGFFGFGD